MCDLEHVAFFRHKRMAMLQQPQHQQQEQQQQQQHLLRQLLQFLKQQSVSQLLQQLDHPRLLLHLLQSPQPQILTSGKQMVMWRGHQLSAQGQNPQIPWTSLIGSKN